MVKSADRVMQILKIVGSSKEGLKHSEIAGKLKIPKGSLSFLLADLISEDFLNIDKNGLYKLGPQILILANNFLTGLDIVDLSYPIIKKLVESTNESAGLGIPMGEDIVIVTKRNAPQQLKLEFDIGEHFPIYASAAGKVILAYSNDEAINVYFSSVTLIPITKNTIIDKETLRMELKKIRKESIAISTEELYSGRMAMAVPVFQNDTQVIAAIAQSIPTIRFTPEKEKLIRQALLDASNELSHKLGYRQIL